MARINVFDYGDENAPEVSLEGWFEEKSATLWKESRDWDDAATHQELFRTAGGRWVRCNWTQYQGSEPRYWFVVGEEARTWLLINGYDEDVVQYFGELEEESGPGPDLGGRPPIGPKVEVRIPKETLARIDAAKGDQDRASILRQLIEAGLDTLHPA